MRLRAMVLLVAVVPLVIAIAGIVWLLDHQLADLAIAQIREVQAMQLQTQARRDELKRLVHLNARMIVERTRQGGKPSKSQREALVFLRASTSNDSYFAVYEVDGRCLLDPALPDNEGRDCRDDVDSQGRPFVRNLVGQALAGGGFVEHSAWRPSTKRSEMKLSYAEWIPEWNWVVVTGLYADSLPTAAGAITESTKAALARTRNQILAIGAVALLSVGGAASLINWRDQQKANSKLREMAKKVVASQEAERTRVAQELHDGVSQSLAALKFKLESAAVHFDRGNGDAAVALLRGALQEVRAVMREVRQISHNLRPTLLDDVGLSAALTQTAREFSERTSIAVESRIESPMDIPDAVSTSVFRVTQEALSNIERHARASHVTVELAKDRAGLTLTVGDDGPGFDAAAVMRRPRAGLGLTSMRERIENLGGRFALQSAPGTGRTVITATLPLPT